MDGRADCLVHLKDDIEYTSEDGVFLKGMIMDKAGTLVSQHSHEYGHTTLIARGSVSIWKNDVYIGDFKAPAFIYIEPKAFHKFMSLEDNTHAYCVHNVGKGGKVDVYEKAIVELVA